MKKIILSSAFIAMASVASAKEVTFFFDVHSSGPEIYPCDAGMVQPDKGRFCHFKGTATSCTPEQIGLTPAAIGAGQVLTSDGLPVPNPADGRWACICTGTNGGAYLMNFLRYKAAIWEPTADAGDNPNHIGWTDAQAGVIQGTKEGVTVARDIRAKLGKTVAPATSVPQELATQLEAVTFNFGSELYGANFFVDLCYRGPQLPYYIGNDAMNAKATFTTKAYITGTNPFTTGTRSTLDYVTIADLALSWDVSCDHQGQGDYQFDHNGSSLNDPNAAFDTLLTDITDSGKRTIAGYTDHIPTSGTKWVGNLSTPRESNSFYRSGSFNSADLNTHTQNWLFGGANSWATITNNSAKVPRFCKLRYYFAEKPFADRERAWQRADARFIVKWAVEETE